MDLGGVELGGGGRCVGVLIEEDDGPLGFEVHCLTGCRVLVLHGDAAGGGDGWGAGWIILGGWLNALEDDFAVDGDGEDACGFEDGFGFFGGGRRSF